MSEIWEQGRHPGQAEVHEPIHKDFYEELDEEEEAMGQMKELALEIEQRAAETIRQSDEDLRVRVAMARAVGGAFHDMAGFDLTRFIDDCFAADVEAGVEFMADPNDDMLYEVRDGRWQVLASGLGTEERRAFWALAEGHDGPAPGTSVVITIHAKDSESATLLVDSFNEWARHPEIDALMARTDDTPSGRPESDYRIETRSVGT